MASDEALTTLSSASVKVPPCCQHLRRLVQAVQLPAMRACLACVRRRCLFPGTPLHRAVSVPVPARVALAGGVARRSAAVLHGFPHGDITPSQRRQ